MLQFHDEQYLKLMSTILEEGEHRANRTDTDVISIFGNQMEFNLSDNTIPLLTTKRVHLKSIIYELLWFLSGSTNIKELHKHGITIWDEWADKDGELGPVYGYQWRKWDHVEIQRYQDSMETVCGTNTRTEYCYNAKVLETHIDQITILINQIKNNPMSRRLMVSAWNVADINKMKLPPCHYAFQCYVSTTGTLSLKIHQRSCDMFLGVPFNIAQYGILLHMIAHVCNLKPGKLIWSGGDIHIYNNHVDQCKLQLSRRDVALPSPKLQFTRTVSDIFDFTYHDFAVVDYFHYDEIKAPVSK